MKEEEKVRASEHADEARTNSPEKKELVRAIDSKKIQMNKKFISLFAVLVVAGLLTGLLFAFLLKPTSQSVEGGAGSEQTIVEAAEKGSIIGSADEDNFSDEAEGVLQDGGIEGEGTHHLERPGGESQNVYLTSSVIDLSKFIGREVKVWGETFDAQKAGWLMDVGRLQLLD